jgi:hypothetical protein
MDIPCICPPLGDDVRHPDGDSITLRERLDFQGAASARNTIVMMRQEDSDYSTAEIMAGLSEVYIVHGITAWTVVDERGKAVEPDRAAIRQYLLGKPDVALLVGEEVDALYSDSVISPLVERASMPSQPTPTPDSTSPTNGSGPKHPKQSRRSSTITTLTDDTETTSPSLAGVSRS